MTTRHIVRQTRSLCPVCLRRVDAAYVDADGEIQLRKTCPEHGDFQVRAWKTHGAAPAFAQWRRAKTPAYPEHPATDIQDGCPYDCGLCPEHGQHTCTGLVEVTTRCNLRCPVCYADAGAGDDLPLEDVARRLHALHSHSGACNVQLSGGEPTVREDLPEIVALARRQGFGLVQVNTNGLRLAEAGYAARLAAAGLDSVYLQWDGTTDAICAALRGRACLKQKKAGLRACREAGLGVVLVATLARGINDGNLGELLRWAVAQGPVVRGLHLQPVSSFGRFPWSPDTSPRLTLPEVMELLEAQSGGWVRAGHFHPPGCEHFLCSFSAVYQRQDGELVFHEGAGSCCGPDTPPETAAEGARKSRNLVAQLWKTPKESPDGRDFAAFLTAGGAQRRFTLSAMAFQDALSLDLERVRGCCIHVVGAGGRLVPFCLYNLTATGGQTLYRGKL